MTTALVISVVWLTVAWVVAILVGRTVRLRDERETPTGPRVRVSERTVRPWVKR